MSIELNIESNIELNIESKIDLIIESKIKSNRKRRLLILDFCLCPVSFSAPNYWHIFLEISIVLLYKTPWVNVSFCPTLKPTCDASELLTSDGFSVTLLSSGFSS